MMYYIQFVQIHGIAMSVIVVRENSYNLMIHTQLTMCVYPGRGGNREITVKNLNIYIRGQVVNYSQYPHTWGGGGGGYPSLTHCHGGDREKEINREKVGRYNFLIKYKKFYRSGVLYKYKKKIERGSVNGYVRTYICTYITIFFNSE